MESALKQSALAQPFGVGDAIKSSFGLFNLFLEANQIVLQKTYMLQLFLKLLYPEHYLDINYRLLHLRVNQFCLLVER